MLFIYAVFWQQILKKIPLTTAFANKSVVIIWGMIWGRILFEERISWYMAVGAVIVFVGIILVVSADE